MTDDIRVQLLVGVLNRIKAGATTPEQLARVLNTRYGTKLDPILADEYDRWRSQLEARRQKLVDEIAAIDAQLV